MKEKYSLIRTINILCPYAIEPLGNSDESGVIHCMRKIQDGDKDNVACVCSVPDAICPRGGKVKVEAIQIGLRYKVLDKVSA